MSGTTRPEGVLRQGSRRTTPPTERTLRRESGSVVRRQRGSTVELLTIQRRVPALISSLHPVVGGRDDDDDRICDRGLPRAEGGGQRMDRSRPIPTRSSVWPDPCSFYLRLSAS